MEMNAQDHALLDWLRRGARPGTRRPDMEYERLVELLRPLQYPDKLSEWEWQRIVLELCKAYGWKATHKPPGKTVRGKWVTTGSPGFPDVTAVKPGHRVIFLELKKQAGKADPRQIEWLKALQSVGGTVEAYVLRPRQIRQLVELLAEQPEQG